MPFISYSPDAKGVTIGAITGAGQTTLTQALDANGTFGPAPVPQLGGFGTVGGIIDTATGLVTLGLGLAGACGKGPLRNSQTAKGWAIGHGASALTGRGIATALNTPAVTVPGAIARGMAARQGGPNGRANFAGGVAPRAATPGVSSTSYKAAFYS